MRTDLPYGAHRSALWRTQICLMAHSDLPHGMHRSASWRAQICLICALFKGYMHIASRKIFNMFTEKILVLVVHVLH